MERIIDKRGTGKTYKLLNLAKNNNGVIVCSDPTIFREKAYAYGITGIDFVSFGEFLKSPEIYKYRKVYVDELEGFIRKFPNIEGYTLSFDF